MSHGPNVRASAAVWAINYYTCDAFMGSVQKRCCLRICVSLAFLCVPDTFSMRSGLGGLWGAALVLVPSPPLWRARRPLRETIKQQDRPRRPNRDNAEHTAMQLPKSSCEVEGNIRNPCDNRMQGSNILTFRCVPTAFRTL